MKYNNLLDEIEPAQSMRLSSIPTVAEAIASPLGYEVTRSALGWTLSNVGDDVALFLAPCEAQSILEAMAAAEAREDADEQSRLDEEYGL